MSTPKNILVETVIFFTELSTEFQANITTNPKDYMYSKVAYKLGAVFNSIMAQLIGLDPIYTSYKEYRSYGMFTRVAPVPGPLKWDSEDSYELRLLQVLYKDYAVRRKQFNTLKAVHEAILNGVEQAIAAQTTGATVVQNPYAQVAETPRSTIQDWPNSLPGAVDEQRSLLRGGGRTTRRRKGKGKRGSRRN